MAFVSTEFPGLLVFEPTIWEDDRGYFYESYNTNTFTQGGVDRTFLQDNQAKSGYGVIRGMHYQLNPFAQSKLIRVLSGKIIDAVVDLRKGSPTYSRSFVIELSSDNKKQLFIPQGFAHGYSVISETAEVFYKTDQFYNKNSEGSISLKDPALNIDWQISLDNAIISDKDKVAPLFIESNSNFEFNK